jgi:hypothetical protein
MANIKFKWNPAGYRELKNSARVQSIIESKAQRVKDTANANLSAGGYVAIDDFEKHQVTLTPDDTKAQIVVTHSEHAKRAQNKRKTLENALGSASGGE